MQRRKQPERPVRTVVTELRPTARRSGTMGGARPPRPAVAGLAEADLVTLYSAGVVRSMAPGESLALGGADTSYFVVEGPVELRMTLEGLAVDLGPVARGECVEAMSPEGNAAYSLTARDAATVIELNPAALELLPPATQRTLARLAASSVAQRFNMLAARYADLRGRNLHLASTVKQLAARTSRLLKVPQLAQALADIPALPVHVTGLAVKLLDDRARADEVVDSIKNDPALASLVLKRVNSPYYGLETKVSDHYRALLLLGTATVYQLLMESAVESVIPDTPETREIQARATMISVLAYEIALVAKQENPLLASTIGLLHNIGDSIGLVLRRTRPEVTAVVDCLDAPTLGAAVLASWGLPERVHQVVERQQHAELLRPEKLDIHAIEVSILYLAKVCRDVLLDGATPPAHAALYMARLGLRETNCAAFCREVLVPALAKKIESLPAAVRARLAS
jgi:HD-like signal output (HDOD) protein